MYKSINPVFFLLLLPTISTASLHNASWPADTLKAMTLSEKIGHLFMVPVCSDPSINTVFMQTQPYELDPEKVETIVRTYKPGGIIFLGASTPHAQRLLTKRFQTLNIIPLLVGQDLEWGLSMRHQGTIRFPRAMTLGALPPEKEYLIYKMAQEIGNQCQYLGVQINFAPVVDVNVNPANPIINMRSFGAWPEDVARKATLFMCGLADAGILSCAKHFPGHGDTSVDSHHAVPIINHARTRLESTELAPFKHMVEHGIPAIMTAHLRVPALDPESIGSLSRATLTTLLRDTYHFDGLIITDGLGMKGITDHATHAEIAVQAIKAGNDILLCPVDIPAMYEAVHDAVRQHELSEEEIDTHVLRILCAKQWAFMRHNSACNDYDLHNAHACALKRELYRNAITQVRGDMKISGEKPVHFLIIGAPPSSCADYFKTVRPETHIHYVQTASDAETIIATLSCHDQVVVCIYPASKARMIEESSTIAQQPSIPSLCQQIVEKTPHAYVILFDTPYRLPACAAIPNCLLAYEDDEEAQYAAADVLLGNLIPVGKLPV